MLNIKSASILSIYPLILINMNLKRIILLSLVLFQLSNLFCQNVDFSYDDNGNRISRILTVEQLKQNTVVFPVINPKSLKILENVKGSEGTEYSKDSETEASTTERIRSEDGKIVILIYPNPTKGIIKIDISNMPPESNSEMRLYDLSGMELVVKRNFDSFSEIDISLFKDGIYILRIKINDRMTDWKIVKNH
jgi:hypothetical protein